MIKQADKILAETLVKQGVFSRADIEKYSGAADSSGQDLRGYLVKQNLADEQRILSALAAASGLETADLRNIQIDPDVIDKVPVRFAWFFKFMPIRIENKTLTLASAAPLDIKLRDEIRVHLGLEPRTLLARETDVLDALNKYYGFAADTIDKLSKESLKEARPDTKPEAWVEDLEQEANEASVAKLVNQILLGAYKKRATDIHIEPYRNKVRVRYRIDGVLVDANVPAGVRQFLLSIISRIKLMANLSIVEKRVPQDGSAVVKTKEQDLDLRISTIPTPWGESMVIRLLPTDVKLLNLSKLGLDSRNLQTFRGLIKKPHGIILVTGPTGSGKTTTLYACLMEINGPERKIITLEDPIEYEMEGITQIQVNPKVHMDFAAGLRAVLRHDPDIIMVGEVRDLETAEIAIRTALTGHLVFSTLHTNDAASGITRLVEMGLEPYLVASSIEAFVAQRLVRVICPDCKHEVSSPRLELREEIARSLAMDVKDVKIYQGRGCDRCNGTGFYGRTAIYETLIVNEVIRTAILEKSRSDHIKTLAVKNGMLTLRQDGWRKVTAGTTTPGEVMNVTARDEEPGEQPPPPAGTASAGTGVSRTIRPEVLSAKDDYNSRIYPRLTARMAVRYVILKQDPSDPTKLISDKVEHASVTKDISAGGLRFVSGYVLPVGTIVELKVSLGKAARSITCLARVCRVEDDTLSAMYNLVAYYLDISGADRVRLNQYVQAQLEKGPQDKDSSPENGS